MFNFPGRSSAQKFLGQGPDIVTTSPEFLLAVSLGTGIMTVGLDINLSVLDNAFFLPLPLSPLIAVLLGSRGYLVLFALRGA